MDLNVLVINPTERTIEPVTFRNHEVGGYKQILACIPSAMCFAAGYTEINGKEITFFVDDEGLLKPNTYFHVIGDGGHDLILAGNSVVMGGADEEGNSLSCPLDIDTLKQHIEFVTKEEAIEIYNRLYG